MEQHDGDYDSLIILNVEDAENVVKWIPPVDQISRSLRLDGLTFLSPDVAKVLAKWPGKRLSLNGLATLSDDVAEALAEWRGTDLSLNGLMTLPTETAEALAEWGGEFLSLNGLAFLSGEAAEVMENWQGRRLSLGIKSPLSIDVSDSLLEWSVEQLDLHLETLSIDIARNLTNWPNEHLTLSVRLPVSWEVAEYLAEWDTHRNVKATMDIHELMYSAAEDEPSKAPESVATDLPPLPTDERQEVQRKPEGTGLSVHVNGSEKMDIDLEPDSPLSIEEYTTGKTSKLNTDERQRILVEVFQANTFPDLKPPERLEKWGEPYSEKRLCQMAYHIHYCCERMSLKNSDCSKAIADREEDLAWLKKNIYDRYKFSFPWPGGHFQPQRSRGPMKLAPFKPRKPDPGEQQS